MKKILSVLLAVMMLFGALSITSSAAYITNAGDALTIANGRTPDANGKDYVVVHFSLEGYKMMNAQPQYNTETGSFESVTGVTGSYYRIPQDAGELYIGSYFTLPEVSGTDTYKVDGWYCAATSEYLVAGKPVELTADMISQDTGCIELRIAVSPTAPEEDTMAKVLGILTKVFGAIIGILFYNGDTGAGVKLMEQILGGLSL